MLVSTITLKGLHKEIRLQVNVKGKGKAVPLKARSGPEWPGVAQRVPGS